MNKKQKRTRNRILLAIALFVVVYVVAELLPLSTWLGSETAALWAEFALFLVPYLIAGYDVLLRAAKNIGHGQVFDENFLMSVATIGAFALVLFPDSDPHMAEGAAVMLFYQVGELFQSYDDVSAPLHVPVVFLLQLLPPSLHADALLPKSYCSV